jgi:predicted P-loop ATPase
MLYNRELTIATAGNRHSTSWQNQTIWWSELIDRLRTAVRGTETLAEYLQLPKRQQDDLKDIGGFVGGALNGRRRKASAVAGRDLITLDIDTIPPFGTDDVLRRIDGLGCAYVVYSTRKHAPDRPRLRLIVPTDRTMTPDEYEPIARKLAEMIGIEMCDPTTFQVARLMYWPSCCADSQYIYHYGDKPFLSADGMLALYADWRDWTQWPQVPGADAQHVRLAAKQGDPHTKPGVVGAFCRQYDVLTAIETFLPGVYAPTDDPTRWTYAAGSTTGGAVIYDDGKFLYSHHATDPCSGRLVNAFDLVRLHKFGDLDDDAAPGTPTNRLPSYSAMVAFALQDAGVAAAMQQERYERAVEAFQSSAPAGGLPRAGEQPAEQSTDWIRLLELSPTTGRPAKTIDNIVIILEHDPLLRGKIAYDEFAIRGMTLGPLPWDPRPERRQWTDTDDAGLRHYLERAYGITGKEKVLDATALVAHRHRYNEVQDYLRSLVWDGVPRLDTILIDYLGAEDNVYTRAVARKAIVAAVARAMQPGVKYDNMPILAGPQGIGKSTFLRILGRKWYSDSLTTFEGKEASELIQGIWINEIAELQGFNKSETNAIKQFLSRTEDIYREPYGRRTTAFPRRCVFWGTTNDAEFLRDATGNRRFWPVDVGLHPPKKSVFNDLEQEVDQIYAEAVVYWQQGEPLYLTGEAAEIAKQQQEEHREGNAKEGLIREFVERPVPPGWEKRDIAARRLYWAAEFGRGEGETVPRDRVCAAEIWVECFGGELKHLRRAETVEINNILARLPGWSRKAAPIRCGPYGVQKGFYREVGL